MQYTNPITIDGTLTARITFIIFIILLFLIICGFSSLEMKLVNKQAKEVDRYMAGVIANKLLHSPQDYKKHHLKIQISSFQKNLDSIHILSYIHHHISILHRWCVQL